jgi:hypothetical protein
MRNAEGETLDEVTEDRDGLVRDFNYSHEKLREVQAELKRIKELIKRLTPYPCMANTLNVPSGYEIVSLERLKAIMDEG